jgi:hypothetical protein
MLPYVAMILCFRMWTLPEASEIARPNANVEEGNVPVAGECGSKKVCRLLLSTPRIPQEFQKAEALFRYPNSPSNFTMQKEDSPSH